MKVTVKKIAELAGVSIGTVDRALNNRKGVNKEVADRIRNIAESLGYAPNIAAKALVTRRKALKIGVIIHTAKHPFFEEVYHGVMDAAEEIKDYGVSVIVKYGKGFDVEDQLQLIEELVADDISGLAIVPLHDERIRKRIEALQQSGIEVALMVSDEPAECLASVSCDPYKVGRTACGLVNLMTTGQCNLLFATAPLRILNNIERLRGIEDSIREKYNNISLKSVCELPNDQLRIYSEGLKALQEQRDINVIIAAVGYYEGFFQAVVDSSLCDQVRVIAMDQSRPVIRGLQSGLVAATVIQHPYVQGKRVIDIIFQKIAMGKGPELKKIYIENDIRIFENV
ncbi:MAG: LacI family DNA-binding transcriptional regulator [Clostridia bacterium]